MNERKQLINRDIRKMIEENRLYYYEVADEIGITSTTLAIWLRKPLNKEKKETIKGAITRLLEDKKKTKKTIWRIDMDTARYIAEHVMELPEKIPLVQCPKCEADYIKELGHRCNNIIDLECDR